MRLEYSILLERLESHAVGLPEYDDISPPPSPSYNFESEDKSPKKKLKKAVNKKIRDPNLPKRPTNAYLIFCESEKERIKKESGDNSLTSINELGKTLIEKWKNLTEAEKKQYHKLFEEAKERYQKEMLEYKNNNVDLNEIDDDEDDDENNDNDNEPHDSMDLDTPKIEDDNSPYPQSHPPSEINVDSLPIPTSTNPGISIPPPAPTPIKEEPTSNE